MRRDFNCQVCGGMGTVTTQSVTPLYCPVCGAEHSEKRNRVTNLFGFPVKYMASFNDKEILFFDKGRFIGKIKLDVSKEFES